MRIVRVAVAETALLRLGRDSTGDPTIWSDAAGEETE
jgi:hypothetical protein